MKITYDRYPELQQFLKTLVEFAATSLSTRSVILFGGLTLDDFSKRYSKIDIIIVLEKSLWEKDFDTIDEIIKKLENLNNEFAHILEAYFIPITMIENPRIKYDDAEGMIVRNLQQELISQYPLSLIDDYMVQKFGEIMFGDDIRQLFPIPPLDCFWINYLNELSEIEKLVNDYPFQYTNSPNYNHATNWILYFPRMLYSLKNNTVIGKFKGAYWFSNEYFGKLGEFVVEVATCRQRNISLANVLEVVERSRKLLLFALEKAFEIKNIHITSLTNLLKVDGQQANFTRIFMEVRNIVDNVRKASA